MPAELEFDLAHAGRFVRLNGAHNFRSLAGWRTEDGMRIAPGVLYRASSLHLLDDNDLAALASLAIAHVFDLRTQVEREAYRSRWPTDPTSKVWTGAEGSANADLSRLMTRPALTTPDLHTAMRRVYADFPQDLGAAISDVLETLASGDSASPALIHCAAGKDRTGFVSAMVMRALGVREQDVRADYLLTNASFAEAYAAFATGHGLDRLEAAVPGAAHAMLGAHMTYLDSANGVILDRWGSHDAYLREVAGLSPAIRERLRSRLLVPEG